MKAKNWNILVLAGTGAILLLLSVMTIVIDPFLHYHKPLESLEYPLKDERYQNDGIARWYDYDAIITGTSMTQNFKASEWNEVMGVTAIKTSYSGASFHELTESIERAFGHNSNVKMVFCSLDGSRMLYPAKDDEYEGYPDYLYDENPFNDVEYVLNKEVVPMTLAVVNYTRAGEVTPDMDTYGSWAQYKSFGAESVKATLAVLPDVEEEIKLSEDDITMICENMEQNFLAMAQRHPETEFYFFIPPYSICYWEALYNTKQLNAQLETEMLAIEILLQAKNVHIYSLSNRIDIVGDLNNYMDSQHYSEEINSEIIQTIARGEGELTLENYQEFYQQLRELYMNYDYSTVWE